MNQLGKTPDEMAAEPLGDACALEASSGGATTADRIALAAIFSAAILVLVTFELTDKSAMPPVIAAATVPMSSYLGPAMSNPDSRMPIVTTDTRRN